MADSPRTSPPLALHHVGTLVDDIEAATRRLVGRFGYAIESPVIGDPAQTARVRFLRLPGADHWLELVTPNGETSKLRNALRKGVTLHHLCYEVADLAAALEHLRDSGMLVVGDPTPAVAFGGRRIAWLMDRHAPLVELLEAGAGPFGLAELRSRNRRESA